MCPEDDNLTYKNLFLEPGRFYHKELYDGEQAPVGLWRKRREMGRVQTGTRVWCLRHSGHRFKEAHFQGHKVGAQNPDSESFLEFVPCNASLAYPSACSRQEGLWVLPRSNTIYVSPHCGCVVMEKAESCCGVCGLSPEKAQVIGVSLAALSSLSLLSGTPCGRCLWMAGKCHISCHALS